MAFLCSCKRAEPAFQKRKQKDWELELSCWLRKQTNAALLNLRGDGNRIGVRCDWLKDMNSKFVLLVQWLDGHLQRKESRCWSHDWSSALLLLHWNFSSRQCPKLRKRIRSDSRMFVKYRWGIVRRLGGCFPESWFWHLLRCGLSLQLLQVGLSCTESLQEDLSLAWTGSSLDQSASPW